MRFTDINLFGVYVAPISVMMVAAWLIVVGLRRIAAYLRASRSGSRPWLNRRMRVTTESAITGPRDAASTLARR